MANKKNTYQENVVQFQNTIKNICDLCISPLLFQMRDQYHKFSLDLLTILRCLQIAEKQGAIPAFNDKF